MANALRALADALGDDGDDGAAADAIVDGADGGSGALPHLLRTALRSDAAPAHAAARVLTNLAASNSRAANAAAAECAHALVALVAAPPDSACAGQAAWALGNLAASDAVAVWRLGALPALVTIAAGSDDGAAAETSLWALANVLRAPEAALRAARDTELVRALSARVAHAPPTVAAEAAWAACELACSARTGLAAAFSGAGGPVTLSAWEALVSALADRFVLACATVVDARLAVPLARSLAHAACACGDNEREIGAPLARAALAGRSASLGAVLGRAVHAGASTAGMGLGAMAREVAWAAANLAAACTPQQREELRMCKPLVRALCDALAAGSSTPAACGGGVSSASLSAEAARALYALVRAPPLTPATVVVARAVTAAGGGAVALEGADAEEAALRTALATAVGAL